MASETIFRKQRTDIPLEVDFLTPAWRCNTNQADHETNDYRLCLMHLMVLVMRVFLET
jgi:hypothetical protein